ncbi:cytochrome c biogenesis protein/redoxin [Candidatus Gracilibacteria bacterium]|nr:cytochrome c biogenesis protein/redoxin [Candidatus Gracilibacteria bacterium]
MTLLILAFFAGVLTVLTPCVLPLLPIVFGTSLEGHEKRYAPFLVILGLSISIFIFSIALKASTLLIDIHPYTWKYLSGGILIFLGLVYIFPNLWKSMSSFFKINSTSSQLLQKAGSKKGITKYLLLGAALGPVFSSCSPTYLIILAIILPVSLVTGLSALLAYILGLAVVLSLIAFFGQKFSQKLKVFSRKNISKILGVLFLLIGLAIILGYDKKVEAWILEKNFLNLVEFEYNLTNQLDLEQFETQSAGVLESKNDVYKIEGLDIGQEGYGCTDSGHCINTDIEVSGSIVGQKAPEISGVGEWRNSQELTMEEHLGSVVLVKFWTSGCINCIRSHEGTNELFEKFSDEDFKILSFHSPEFSYEKNIEEVEKSITSYDIIYPVIQDNDFTMFRAYKNRYWPAYYLIDREGIVRYEFFGDKNNTKIEEKIEDLLLDNIF